LVILFRKCSSNDLFRCRWRWTRMDCTNVSQRLGWKCRLSSETQSLIFCWICMFPNIIAFHE
jgi:hypothetical protein